MRVMSLDMDEESRSKRSPGVFPGELAPVFHVNINLHPCTAGCWKLFACGPYLAVGIWSSVQARRLSKTTRSLDNSSLCFLWQKNDDSAAKTKEIVQLAQ